MTHSANIYYTAKPLRGASHSHRVLMEQWSMNGSPITILPSLLAHKGSQTITLYKLAIVGPFPHGSKMALLHLYTMYVCTLFLLGLDEPALSLSLTLAAAALTSSCLVSLSSAQSRPHWWFNSSQVLLWLKISVWLKVRSGEASFLQILFSQPSLVVLPSNSRLQVLLLSLQTQKSYGLV